jgi:protein gp37
MGKNSAIEWTDNTFNPWWGCTKVSPACKHCYAADIDRRFGGGQNWGARSPRRLFADDHWLDPMRWNKAAAAAGARQRVFCASMADVFERRVDLDPWRDRLWALISSTPWLDWLLLTKRPERVTASVPWGDEWPENVWLGTTAENQFWADRRIPALVRIPAVVRFVSCEPLLGAVDLSSWLSADRHSGIDWVIAGGESGTKARPTHPDRLRQLRDQCIGAGVAFHFKQWGNWRPDAPSVPIRARRLDVAGFDGSRITLARMAKDIAGRELDGQTWDEYPVPRSAVAARVKAMVG